MSNRNLFKDLSANTVQTIITQVSGVVIFYILSRYINKEAFGEYNWSTAVGSTIIAICSLGLDIVLVKRIAAGDDPKLMANVHFLHTLIVGIVAMSALALSKLFAPGLLQAHPLLIVVILQLVLSNIANSFKFSLTGLESFRQLAIISFFLNASKIALLFALFWSSYFTIDNIILGFVFASGVELAIAYSLLSKRLTAYLKPLFRRSTYKAFILESLPQLAVELSNSALARIDWILLGIYSTAAITAEYSFAFKFFELSRLPVFILAPIMLTRFSRLLASDQEIDATRQSSVQALFAIGSFISFLIPIAMVCTWTDLIDLITDNKYGASNHTVYSILAICVPLHFVINFLWTIGFAQGQLKTIMYITIAVSLLNICGNIILIPLYGSKGAACSFLFSSIIQLCCYFFTTKREKLKIQLRPFFILLLWATLAIATANYIFTNKYIAAIFSICIYSILAVVSRQVSKATITRLKTQF